MLGGDETEYQDFLTLHKPQLEHAGIPKRYYRRLYEKLYDEIYDSGSYFILLTDGTESTRYNIVTAQVDKMHAELANLSHCAVPFFKPRRCKLVLVLLYN